MMLDYLMYANVGEEAELNKRVARPEVLNGSQADDFGPVKALSKRASDSMPH